ncbi:MAG: magnesium transporter [Defluviitaleaceae bacterium]|nr:magnesium transporter [Defluviitaleaceae bacterium]
MNNEERITDFTNSVISNIQSLNMDSLKTLLGNSNEVDILDMILDLSVENQAVVYRLLSKDTALFVFERLDTSDQQKLIRSFTEESAIEIITALEPDERVRLFDEMPATFTKKMLSALSPEEREMTNLLMGYEIQTAGHIMTPEYVRISRNMTVSEALEKVKENAKEKETIYTIYITDDARILEGVISLRELLIADPTKKVEDVMEKIAAKVSTDTDQEEVARLLQRLDWLAIPVVDNEGRLVGIVTIDDAVDILEEETTEDIFDAAGLADVVGSEADRSEVLTKGHIWRIWAVRLPFLVITLAAGMAAGLIIGGFEEILESVVIVAFFIPLIMDMGGTVGTQSSTVFARGVVLGHINVKQFLKPFLKEVSVGLSMGAMVGIVAGALITIWIGIPRLGIAVGISLIATMTLAAALGFLVPFALIKLKVDQAAGSAPVITSIKDISGLFIYFVLVATLMSGYLAPEFEITGMNITVDGIHFFVDMEEATAVVTGTDEHAGDIEIPEMITVHGEEFVVIAVEAGAFRGTGLTGLALPDSIILIGNNAFRDNYLAHVDFPSSLQSIGNNAFRDNQLNLVIFYYGLEFIGQNAFRGNILEEVTLPDSLQIIERGGFRDNLLMQVELPGSLQLLGSRAFMDNALTTVIIPSSVLEFADEPESGQRGHFNNNNIETIFSGLINISALAENLTAEVLGNQSSEVVNLVETDTNSTQFQIDNLARNPSWEAVR